MSDYVEGFTEIKEDQECLFPRLHILGKFINDHDELCLEGSFFPGIHGEVQIRCFGQ